MDNWVKRLVRASPGACGFWRIEWKARLSGAYVGKLVPHFHCLVWGLDERQLPSRYTFDQFGNVEDEIEVFEAFVDLPDSQLTLSLLNHLSCLPDNSPLEIGVGRSVITSGVGQFCFTGKARFRARCSDIHNRLVMERLVPDSLQAQAAKKMPFADWASLAWYHVVASHNQDHLKAGVRVERVRTWGGVMSYCAKYMAKADCEFLSDVAFGRSWGVFNRKSMPWAKIIELELPRDVGVRLRRVARHYLDRVCGRKRARPYGLTLYCDVAQWSKLLARPPDTPF
jgi:hypothetical protein